MASMTAQTRSSLPAPTNVPHEIYHRSFDEFKAITADLKDFVSGPADLKDFVIWIQSLCSPALLSCVAPLNWRLLSTSLQAELGTIDEHLADTEALASCFETAFALPALATVDRCSLFSNIKAWALGALEQGPLEFTPTVPPPVSGCDGLSFTADTLEISAHCCRGILANAFLGNVLDPMLPYKSHRGGLHFRRLFTDRSSIGAHKVACLLLYFASPMEGEERLVRFDHLRCPPSDAFEAAAARCDNSVAVVTRLHNGPMEAPAAKAFVNFANCDFGCEETPTEPITCA